MIFRFLEYQKRYHEHLHAYIFLFLLNYFLRINFENGIGCLKGMNYMAFVMAVYALQSIRNGLVIALQRSFISLHVM